MFTFKSRLFALLNLLGALCGVTPFSRDIDALGERSPGFTNGKDILYGSKLESRLTITLDVIIQMFEWSWDTVASECTSFIGPAGYGFVQVSPPQEHVQGSQWWTDYQPVSYILTSKRGNRSQFQNMINTCHAAGVKVIVDTVWNHMTGSGTPPGTGTAGSCK